MRGGIASKLQDTSSSKLLYKLKKEISKRVLIEEVGELNIANMSLVEKVSGLQVEVDEFKKSNRDLIKRNIVLIIKVDELVETNIVLRSRFRFADRMILHIALKIAHEKLTKDLGRSLE